MALTGCGEKQPAGVHKVEVLEVVQAPNYTYMRVEDDNEYWMAVPKLTAEKGSIFYWTKGMEMKNFNSPAMKRTFESIWFIEDLSKTPPAAPDAPQATNTKPGTIDNTPQKPKIVKSPVSVTKADGGKTIAEIFANLNSFDGKTVVIRGQITKANTGIMGKNWYHIQDGSDYNGEFDLTVTSEEELGINTVVTFKGKIALNKDFGYGYSYKVILEEAVSVK
jgi:hypothetical protein